MTTRLTIAAPVVLLGVALGALAVCRAVDDEHRGACASRDRAAENLHHLVVLAGGCVDELLDASLVERVPALGHRHVLEAGDVEEADPAHVAGARAVRVAGAAQAP